MKQYLPTVGISFAMVVLAFLIFPRVTNISNQTLGASSGTDHLGYEQFLGGVTFGNVIATTTKGTTATLTAADMNGYDVIVLNPNIAAAETITFPASSTVRNFLPKAGMTQTTCFVNASTTATAAYTFAGGTGFTLEVASSTATVLGSSAIYPRKVGCFTFVREPATATTFDILALFSAYQ